MNTPHLKLFMMLSTFSIATTVAHFKEYKFSDKNLKAMNKAEPIQSNQDKGNELGLDSVLDSVSLEQSKPNYNELVAELAPLHKDQIDLVVIIETSTPEGSLSNNSK